MADIEESFYRLVLETVNLSSLNMLGCLLFKLGISKNDELRGARCQLFRLFKPDLPLGDSCPRQFGLRV